MIIALILLTGALSTCKAGNTVDSILYNLALKKPTSQSSTGWSGVSGRAVDGLVSGRYSDNTCTHTADVGWWKVDLQNFYNVEKIVIFNREDCCSNRLNGVKVYVGDMLCGTVSYLAGKVEYVVTCAGGMVGDSVKIVNSNSYLTLCEVKVMGKNDAVVDAELSNCQQSSTYCNSYGRCWPAIEAIDGNSKTWSMTNWNTGTHWWSVSMSLLTVLQVVLNVGTKYDDEDITVTLYKGGTVSGHCDTHPADWKTAILTLDCTKVQADRVKLSVTSTRMTYLAVTMIKVRVTTVDITNVGEVITSFGEISGGLAGIGQGFYLPDISLVEDHGSGRSIFKEIPLECISTTSSHLNREEKTFFEDTESFYTKIGVASSLSAEITDGFTLGASIIMASNSIDSETLNVKGMSMEVYAMTGFSEIQPDCLKSMVLDEDFVKAFMSLPYKIKDPEKISSWFQYDTVLKTYGSHITKRISHGSKLTHYVFSKSSTKISSSDFLIKVCMTLQDINLKSCSKFTKADYDKVTHLATSEALTIRGGSAITRAKLMNHLTAELMQQFMLEANLAKQPISTQYISIWDILKSRYLGTEHFIKAVNMESYYLGMLNTGCTYEEDRSTVLRRFILVDPNPTAPGYECQLAPLGCRVNDDCHIGGRGTSTCYCHGSSCVDKKSVFDPRHTLSEDRYIKTSKQSGSHYNEGVNKSCYYHFIAHCNCHKSWGSWKTVWPSTHHKRSLSIRRNAHEKLMAQEKLIAQEKFMAVELVE